MSVAAAGRLSGHVALITGAGSGVGRAVAGVFVAEGARVCAFDRRADRVDALAAASDGAVLAVGGDVRSANDLARAVTATVATFGRLDVVVANAGVHDGGTGVADVPPATLEQLVDEVFAVNVKGCLLTVAAAREALVRSGGAVIVTSSISSERAGFGGVAYVASKHAVSGLVRQLALELAPEVRVNAVQLGYVPTGLRTAEAVGGQGALPAAADVVRRIPLGRAPDLDAVAEAFVLLAGPGAGKFMTGAEIGIDGGQRLGGPPPR